jgi:Tol biopolymer transport system component
VVAALLFVRSAVNAPELTLTAVPLTTYSGFQEEPSFSPEGNQVAFTWDGEKRDNADIYLRLIGTGSPPLRLTTDPAADYNPTWSPDGRFIAFLRKLSRQESALLLIPALGGPERKIAEIFNGELPGAASFREAAYLAWTPDGNSLVISDRDSLREPLSLFLLSIDTGEKLRLTFPPARVGDSSPTFSPDGRTLAFIRSVDFGLSDLYLMAFSDGFRPTGDVKRITFENRGARNPAWAADGREIVFSSGGAFGELPSLRPRDRVPSRNG